MKRLPTILTCLLMGLLLALPAAASGPELRGKQLYDAWEKLEITKMTGTTRVTWLPEGQGWLEAETDKAKSTTVFYRVDPRTQKKSRLFSPDIERSIVAEYAKLTGKPAAGLPFAGFSYLPGNAGIFFSVGPANDFVYFFKDKVLRKLERPSSSQNPTAPSIPPEFMQFMRRGPAAVAPGFSPDFTKYAYSKEFDIWIYDLAAKKDEALTTGGSEELMNGKTDWVYPEELSQREAFWWSPDGRKIAYLQFDERAVFNYPIIHELTPDHKPAFEASLELERYPKAGEPNPTVRLFVIDLVGKKPVEVRTESGPDVYITRVAWRRDGSELFFQRLNRQQNRLELKAADSATGEVRTILTEEEPCFVNLQDDFRELADSAHFLWSSERTGWRHLYLYDFSGKLVGPLTGGEWEVEGITLVDEKNRWVYFTIADNFGLDTHFGRVRFDGSKLTRLTTEPGTHRVSIDPAGRYYLDSFSSLTQPPVTNLCQADGKLIHRTASTNIDKVKELGLQEPELVKLRAADDKTGVYGILFRPADFSPEKKYPLYVQVYGGPAHRNSNSYQTAGPKAQLAQLGYLVWELDGRGTTRRGKKLLTETYLKFGQVDVDDQAAGVKQLRQRPYVDASRVGMTGGSYGGYMTCMSLLRYPDVYSVGVAASSVTDWRSYDSIYTERYMRLPAQNKDGYEKGSAMAYAKNLKGKLLLVHGTIDNNVHIGNSIQLIDALQKEGRDFDVMVYPENRHGIRGFNAEHLGRLRLDYFLRNLKPENWEETLKTVNNSSRFPADTGR
jgi:dipeptidyl-peptidase-4